MELSEFLFICNLFQLGFISLYGELRKIKKELNKKRSTNLYEINLKLKKGGDKKLEKTDIEDIDLTKSLKKFGSNSEYEMIMGYSKKMIFFSLLSITSLFIYFLAQNVIIDLQTILILLIPVTIFISFILTEKNKDIFSVFGYYLLKPKANTIFIFCFLLSLVIAIVNEKTDILAFGYASTIISSIYLLIVVTKIGRVYESTDEPTEEETE